MATVASRKVFISYTRTDRRFAHRLAKDVQALGFRVWLDTWEMKVGGSIIEGIESGIDQSAWMIVVLSPAALQSEWVLKELRSGLVKEAQEQKLFLLPVLYKNVVLPAFLRDKFHADFRKSYKAGFVFIKDRLLEEYRAQSQSSWILSMKVKNRYDDEIQSVYYDGTSPSRISHILKGTYRLWPDVSGPYRDLDLPRKGDTKVSHVPEKDVSGTWFSASGRLIIRQNGNHITGDYDWKGGSLVGHFSGGFLDSGVIKFDWNWRLSSEKGSGVFWMDIPNVLYGGWWMDFEDVDTTAVIERRVSPSNIWQFVAVKGLDITFG